MAAVIDGRKTERPSAVSSPEYRVPDQRGAGTRRLDAGRSEHRCSEGRSESGRLARRAWRMVAAALILITTPGCFLGLSSNPFRIGYLHPGDIVRTHAKPSAWGYNRNFDPAARQVTLNHKEVVCKVRTQAVLVAAVCDKDGDGRRNRRVEWHASGTGHMVEVDESGLFPGRG